jgi:hemerythrin-like domain-containing protein
MSMQKRGSTIVRKADPGSAPKTQPRAAGEGPVKRLPPHDVVGALLAEHRYAARLLEVLEDALATASRGQPLDREALLSGVTYMTRHLDGYHHRREDVMFARLVKRDPGAAELVAKVEREHRTIGSTGKHLLAELERLSQGGHGDEAGVISRVGDYVDAMRVHMALEERELFPRALRLLDEHDLEEIDRAFMRVIDPIFEASVRDAYAAYNPVVRYLAEQPAIRQAVGAIDGFIDSAWTLGEILFGEPGRAHRR